MSLRTVMEEALQRGEKFKEQILTEVLSSQAVQDLFQNELFLKSLSRVLNTKYEIQKALKSNVRTMLKVFNVPTREEVHSMERKIHRLETEIDGIHRKILTERLSSQGEKKTPQAKKTSPRKASPKPKGHSH